MKNLKFSAPENANESELKKIVAELSSPVEKPAQTQTEKPAENQTEKPAENQTEKPAESWQGNPKYFQTGKKAGQLKPSAKLKFEKSTEGATKPSKQETVNKGLDAELEALRNEHNQLSEKNQATVVVDNSTVVDKAKTAFLNGYLLLIVCDVFFPMAISYLFKKSLEKNGKTRKDLKLTVKDKEELMPLADAAAKELSLTMSAVQTFALAMCFVYASKVDE